MTEILSEMFQDTNGQPIMVMGKLVHSIYKRPVKVGSILSIKRLSYSHEIIQGLRIKCDNGKLEVNDQTLVDFILWSDTSPAEVIVKVSDGSNVIVKFWNVWRFKEITQAWIGNAGICVEEEGSIVRLRCSDGLGEPNFEDLVIDVKFEDASIMSC